MKLQKLLILLFSIICFGTVYGQKEESNYQSLKFKNISLEEGLSQSSVLCILQDTKGFLWFGTRDGLNRYDGNAFSIYRQNSQDSTSLSHSYIKVLHEDKKGNLWIGTQGGLNKFLPEKNTFQRFLNNGQSNENIEIWSIVEDSNGNLWVGTNLGLKKYDAKKEKFSALEFNASKAAILNSPVKSLLISGNDDLWIKTNNKLALYNINTHALKQYPYPIDPALKQGANSISVLYEDNSKNIWLGLENGLTKFNNKTDAFETYSLKTGNEKRNISNVRTLCEDYLGNLWIGTYNGLYILNPEKTNFSHYVHDENYSYSLSQNSIFKIYQDTKGDIWIGTYAGGISFYDRSYDAFKFFSSGANPTKLNYKVVSAFVEDSNKHLWIGTEGGGINVYNKKTGVFKYYTHNPNNPNSLSANNVKSMIQDHRGNFWIGTHDGGLNFLNPKQKPFKFVKFKNNPRDEGTISNDRVISLLEDHQNNIWIGTSGGGLNVMDTKRNTVTRLKDAQGLAGNIIYTIAKTSDGDNILIGGDKGLAKVDVKEKKIVPFNIFGKKSESVISSPVISIYEDENKNLWIGTEGDGIFLFNMASQEIKKFDVSNGLPNDVIYGILQDNNKNIWLSTNYGLSRIALPSFKIKNFNASDGLQSNEFNYGAYLKNKNGELLFGGANGFNVFSPNAIVENTFVPPVTITSFKVNNKPYLTITDSVKNITLKHTQNVFNFDFVALSYTQPNKNQYAYKLEGFDTDWNYIGNRKSATYTNLDDGEYVFKVKASNNDGLWNEQGVEIPITILPAPWETWWAYVIYMALLALAFLVIRKYSLIRIKDKRALAQERLEKERIEEVNKLKLELFTNISHDFRTPLTLILGPLERLLKIKDTDGFVKKQHQIMYRNASTLMELINQLLDFRKSESGKLQLSASKANIVPFVKDIKLSFEELARHKNIDFRFTSSNEDIEVWYDQTKLKKIIFNLLSNAFKFTDEGGKIAIEVSLHKEQGTNTAPKHVVLKVRDNGKGISKENIKFIFNRFYQLGERTGTGIGLALTKNLVELHKGDIKVKSNENKGTTFSVKLPLGKAHLNTDEIVENVVEQNQDFIHDLEKAAYVDKAIIALEEQNKTAKANIDNTLSSILIVEDNAEVRTFITSIFQDKYNVFNAENGEDAIEITRTHEIDLIISDVMMPVMDGMEMCNEIKTNIKTSHIPVILLTAKTSHEDQKSGYQIGADAYITKPFDANILEVRVVNLLKSRKNLIKKFKKDIILEPKEVTVTSADELFLKKAIEIVEENLSNPEFSIIDFVDGMGTSRSVLYRKLKALTDQSISEFIKTIKLKRAAQLIKKSDMSISEIAYDLGFNDQKHFRKSFKKMFNILPSKYRDS